MGVAFQLHHKAAVGITVFPQADGIGTTSTTEMVDIYHILMLLVFANHVQSVVLFKKHQSVHEEWLQRNHTKITLDSQLGSAEQEVSLQCNNPLPFIGEVIVFEAMNGDSVYGTIDSISSHGADIFVYSGSVQLGTVKNR